VTTQPSTFHVASSSLEKISVWRWLQITIETVGTKILIKITHRYWSAFC